MGSAAGGVHLPNALNQPTLPCLATRATAPGRWPLAMRSWRAADNRSNAMEDRPTSSGLQTGRGVIGMGRSFRWLQKQYCPNPRAIEPLAGLLHGPLVVDGAAHARHHASHSPAQARLRHRKMAGGPTLRRCGLGWMRSTIKSTIWLMNRALVVEGAARSGKAAASRSSAEASILRRLLARHSGKPSARTPVRMWREMLAGTTAMQTAITVAVF